MQCAISGETPQEPVISTKSGHVYEKRLILKALESNKGIDPVTQQALSPEDLLDVKSNPLTKPRPASAASVPGVLMLLQNEYDSLMLESYTLKKQLDSTRQELAHALYQHDAACRVIARLIKERDDARESLANYKSRSTNSNEDGMEVETKEGELPSDVKAKIDRKSAELSEGRRKRAVPSTLSSVEDLKQFKVQLSEHTHSPSQPGITAVDVHPSSSNSVLSGGLDGNVVLFDSSNKKIIKTFKGHGKKVTAVKFHPTEDIFLSSSADKTVRVWAKEEEKPIYTASHDNQVSGLTLQPTGDYFLSGSLDGQWNLHDIKRGASILSHASGDAIHSIQFHPDGFLFGSGEEKGIKVWDIRTSSNLVQFNDHSGHVTSLSFSENGYYLASAGSDNTVRLWDLRKQKSFQSLELPANFNPTTVTFDHSGQYLLVAGSNIRLFTSGKTFNEVASFEKHTAAVTGVAWGQDANSFVSVSMDKSLNVWRK